VPDCGDHDLFLDRAFESLRLVSGHCENISNKRRLSVSSKARSAPEKTGDHGVL
jgi:hypothetical protein